MNFFHIFSPFQGFSFNYNFFMHKFAANEKFLIILSKNRLSMSDTSTSSALGKSKSKIFFHLAAIFTVIVWGASFVSTKVLLDNGLHAVEIYIYRFLLAYVVILFFSHKRVWANNFHDEILLALCGLTSGSIYFIAENVALNYTLVGNVSLLTSTSPLLTTFLVALFYRNERPSKGTYIGSLIALVGVSLVIFNGGFKLTIMPLGDLLALSAALSWAFYSIILRKVNVVYDTLFITRKTFIYGIITAIPFLAFEPQICSPAVLMRGPVIMNLLFLGLIASMACFFLWSIATRGLGPIKTNNYLYFQSIVTLVLAYLFLGESISAIGITGCVLIIVGLYASDKMTSGT